MSKRKEKTSQGPISWAGLAKKVVYAGLGSASMARDMVTDSKLHKELFNGILLKAEKHKDVLFEVLAREVSKFLGKVNVSEELIKALRGLVINLHASIDFKEKKGKGFHPTTTIHSADVKKTVSRK